MKIAVLGGGCVGVTTSLQLQQEFRNATRIDVVATDFDRITSFVAAGIFRVSAFSAPNETLRRKWITDSYEFYDGINRSRDGGEAGVTTISGYQFSNISPECVKNELIKDIVPIYRRATESELQLVGGNWKYGSFMTTILTQPNQYIPWARNKVKNAGANFIQKPIDSLKKIVKDYDLIVNCTGLGAKTLCKDDKIIPIKGQVVKVRAPWLKTFFYGELNTYIIPGTDGLTTLGGCREFESSDMSICPYQTAAIRDRCEKLVPSLKRAEDVTNKAGLRPYREGGVRVEAEVIKDEYHRAMVIHNYGHGGYGICTAPGTSKYAVQLAIDTHRSSARL